MIGRILIGLGIYALAWAIWSATREDVTGGLAMILITIPYATIGLLGLLAGWLWSRGSRLGGPLAAVWLLITGAGLTFEFTNNWLPRLSAIGVPGLTYNWGLIEIWIPVPLAIGAVAIVILGATRLLRSRPAPAS